MKKATKLKIIGLRLVRPARLKSEVHWANVRPLQKPKKKSK